GVLHAMTAGHKLTDDLQAGQHLPDQRRTDHGDMSRTGHVRTSLAARLQLVDADPEDALALFDAAIDSFHQAGNIAQLILTLASATSLFERIDRLEAAGTLYGAIARQPGSDHHVPDLPDLADRLASTLGS